MSTFYLLPSRPEIGQLFADYLASLFPGLPLGRQHWPALADALGAAATCDSDVYVVYREELPEGEDPATALTDGFGATAGDEIIELVPGKQPRELATRRWRLGGAAVRE